jgi:hypothetical protein
MRGSQPDICSGEYTYKLLSQVGAIMSLEKENEKIALTDFFSEEDTGCEAPLLRNR